MNTEEYEKMFRQATIDDTMDTYEKAKEYLAEQERNKWENSTLDIRLKKRKLNTFWWTFGFTTIVFIFTVYNFINNLSSSRKSEQQELRLENIELELKKLQTSISTQKNLDSLRSSKVVNGIENKKE